MAPVWSPSVSTLPRGAVSRSPLPPPPLETSVLSAMAPWICWNSSKSVSCRSGISLCVHAGCQAESRAGRERQHVHAQRVSSGALAQIGNLVRVGTHSDAIGRLSAFELPDLHRQRVAES